MRSVGHVAHMVENRSTYRVFIGKPERNRPLERPRLKWKDNIKVELKGMELEGADWFYLARATDKWRVPVETVKPLPVP